LIPDIIRKKVRLTAGGRVHVSTDNSAIDIKKRIEPKDFIRKTKGAIKRGSGVAKEDPLKLKGIWVKRLIYVYSSEE
jgi:hypothetical protein